jgi:hypothetical protein
MRVACYFCTIGLVAVVNAASWISECPHVASPRATLSLSHHQNNICRLDILLYSCTEHHDTANCCRRCAPISIVCLGELQNQWNRLGGGQLIGATDAYKLHAHRRVMAVMFACWTYIHQQQTRQGVPRARVRFQVCSMSDKNGRNSTAGARVKFVVGF